MPSDYPFEAQATRHIPLYLIQPRSRTPRPDGVPTLLSGELETTSLAIAGIMEWKRGHPRKLQIKSDKPNGVYIDVGGRQRSPYDLFGGVGGDKDFSEIVSAVDRTFEVTVELANAINNRLRVGDIDADRSPLLVVSRQSITVPGIAPQLRGKVADPYLCSDGQPEITTHNFDQLVDAVRKHIEAGDFLLID